MPEGKNHGFFMLVDWSGSMSDKIIETVKQTIMLAEFCRRVNVPFRVATFSSTGADPTCVSKDLRVVKFVKGDLEPLYGTSPRRILVIRSQEG
jgi:nitric oxide reductase activation protein